MAILSDRVRQQLRTRFESQLDGSVQLWLYTRPGSSRLILPAGLGCATCEDAREIADGVRDAASGKVSLEVIDVSRDGERAAAARVSEVPTILVGRPGEMARIRFQGLPAGTEFPAFVDAVERVSRNDPGLVQSSLDALAMVAEPLELMVFATPT